MPVILVVDDEPNIIELLEMVLQENGMDVLKANSGMAAISLLKKENNILIVMIRGFSFGLDAK